MKSPARTQAVPLEKDGFMRSLIGELASVLEDTVGLEEASSYISLVGAALGQQIEGYYKTAYDSSYFSPEEVADILVDLKHRIGGNFSIEHADEDKIVLVNSACPFGSKVVGRTSLCMMTSNVFGNITANSLGYAKVEISEAIARGDARCCVVVYLRKTPEAQKAKGREFVAAPRRRGTTAAE